MCFPSVFPPWGSYHFWICGLVSFINFRKFCHYLFKNTASVPSSLYTVFFLSGTQLYVFWIWCSLSVLMLIHLHLYFLSTTLPPPLWLYMHVCMCVCLCVHTHTQASDWSFPSDLSSSLLILFMWVPSQLSKIPIEFLFLVILFFSSRVSTWLILYFPVLCQNSLISTYLL